MDFIEVIKDKLANIGSTRQTDKTVYEVLGELSEQLDELTPGVEFGTSTGWADIKRRLDLWKTRQNNKLASLTADIDKNRSAIQGLGALIRAIPVLVGSVDECIRKYEDTAGAMKERVDIVREYEPEEKQTA